MADRAGDADRVQVITVKKALETDNGIQFY